jgi:hypothetical protein
MNLILGYRRRPLKPSTEERSNAQMWALTPGRRTNQFRQRVGVTRAPHV